MITPRNAVLSAGFTFALMEAIDAPFIDVPAFAVLFAALFLAAASWFWRSDSGRAAVALLLLFAFETAQAPFWKHTPLGVKAIAGALGASGIIAAVAYLVGRRRRRPLAT